MDARQTIKTQESFLQILKDCMTDKQIAAMLIDDKGISRAQGIISTINTEADIPYLELEDGTRIVIRTIVAVNGLFSPTYSEC